MCVLSVVGTLLPSCLVLSAIKRFARFVIVFVVALFLFYFCFYFYITLFSCLLQQYAFTIVMLSRSYYVECRLCIVSVRVYHTCARECLVCCCTFFCFCLCFCLCFLFRFCFLLLVFILLFYFILLVQVVCALLLICADLTARALMARVPAACACDMHVRVSCLFFFSVFTLSLFLFLFCHFVLFL